MEFEDASRTYLWTYEKKRTRAGVRNRFFGVVCDRVCVCSIYEAEVSLVFIARLMTAPSDSASLILFIDSHFVFFLYCMYNADIKGL